MEITPKQTGSTLLLVYDDRGVQRDALEADGGAQRRRPSAARHTQGEEAVVGVVAGRAAGLVMCRRRSAGRPRPVEQEGVEIRRPPDAAQEQRGDQQ